MTDNRFELTAAESKVPAVVTAGGEIDLADVERFAAVLARAAADSPAVIVDVSAVTYCDSAALRDCSRWPRPSS